MPIFSRFRYTAATIGRSDGCAVSFSTSEASVTAFARRQLERLRRLLHLSCEELPETANHQADELRGGRVARHRVRFRK